MNLSQIKTNKQKETKQKMLLNSSFNVTMFKEPEWEMIFFN